MLNHMSSQDIFVFVSSTMSIQQDLYLLLWDIKKGFKLRPIGIKDNLNGLKFMDLSLSDGTV